MEQSTKIKVSNRVRVMFALTRLEAMFRLRVSLAMGVCFRRWCTRTQELSQQSSLETLKQQQLNLQQDFNVKISREVQIRGAVMMCSITKRLEMKWKTRALRQWQRHALTITLNDTIEHVREEANETMLQHDTELRLRC